MKGRLLILGFLAAAWQCLGVIGWSQATIVSSSATPSTITFSASDPDNPTVPGNVSATITVSAVGGNTNRQWRVQLRAVGSNAFDNCPNTIPIRDVTVTCVSATATNGGSGSCRPPFNLRNGFRQIARGREGAGNFTLMVTVNFVFSPDSWSYLAAPTGAPCTKALDYSIRVN